MKQEPFFIRINLGGPEPALAQVLKASDLGDGTVQVLVSGGHVFQTTREKFDEARAACAAAARRLRVQEAADRVLSYGRRAA